MPVSPSANRPSPTAFLSGIDSLEIVFRGLRALAAIAVIFFLYEFLHGTLVLMLKWGKDEARVNRREMVVGALGTLTMLLVILAASLALSGR
ncbi:MAG TPA: hypothetical protein VJB99_03495 [Patescibacteria group bacterium]|nr:hypothetical protein [Patescibacteria group bacterium]